jgi:cytochrome c5
MRHSVFLIAAGFAIASCAQNAGEQTDSSAVGATKSGINGESAYNEHCAGCHETGMLGAPREGEPVDWEDRSNLWQAVLMFRTGLKTKTCDNSPRTTYYYKATSGRPILSDKVCLLL